MPRHIDADNFRKTMIKRFGCIPCLTDYSEASRYDIPIDDALNLVPTADVVPKSEVADLQDALKCEKETNKHLGAEYIALMKENEKLTINMNAYGLAAKRIAEEKADVAREIFEEIEKYSEVAHWNGLLVNPVLCIGVGTLAELKKKYIGESDVKRDTV